jgi:hypothetical protein
MGSISAVLVSDISTESVTKWLVSRIVSTVPVASVVVLLFLFVQLIIPTINNPITILFITTCFCQRYYKFSAIENGTAFIENYEWLINMKKG